MPDGDIIHSRLTRLYHKLHQWLCEGKANSDECARTAMEALKRDIKRKGNLPVMLAKQMGESLERTIKEAGKSGSVDWTGLNLEFDRLAQKTDGLHYLKELTLHAAKSILRNLRYGQEIDADKVSEAIVKCYMYQVYKSAFKERIPRTPEDYAGIDEATLNRRIEEIQPDIDAAISKWAKKATKDESVANLRLPRRRSLKPVDLDEDLLCTEG